MCRMRMIAEEYVMSGPLEESDCRILDTSCPPNNSIKEIADEVQNFLNFSTKSGTWTKPFPKNKASRAKIIKTDLGILIY